MNWKQIIAMWCGIAVVVLITVKDYVYYIDADFWTVVFLVALVTGGLMVTLADKKPGDKQKGWIIVMRMLAFYLNIAFIVGVSILIIYQLYWGWDPVAVIVFPLFLSCPIVNLVVLGTGREDAGWLGLYFKRKALEEKKKIESLTGNTETQQDKDEQKE